MTIMSAPPDSRPVRRKGRAALTVTLWLVLVPTLLWAIVRVGGWERGPLVQLFAFTPYVAAWAWLPAVVALATRRWTLGGIALVAAVALTACVLPRAIADRDAGPRDGVRLTVMTSNMLFGGADAATIVRLVRENDVAVLAVQEFTAEAQKALDEAGLGDLLPHSSLVPEPQAPGSGLYSRFPLTDPGSRRNGGGFLQAYGTIQPPGAGPVLVESAHPLAPWAVHVVPDWRDDLDAQPRTGEGTPRILLGDFNATLDHAPLRRLIAGGYRDAADAAGRGLSGTWGPYEGKLIPPVTIDHVLVDRRLGVRGASVHRIPRSDHRAIIASLTLP